MKNTLISFLVITIVGCSTQKQTQTTPQTKTIEVKKDASGNLIGHVEKEAFLQESFSDWFVFNYDDYKVDEATIEQLKPLLKNITIKGFMGTWCGDSQEQTPLFYKIMDAVDFNYNNLDLISVNRSKKTPDNLQEGYNIIKVPTFIFYKNGKEIGRFVEYPRETVEADMLKILSGAPYKHSYEN